MASPGPRRSRPSRCPENRFGVTRVDVAAVAYRCPIGAVHGGGPATCLKRYDRLTQLPALTLRLRTPSVGRWLRQKRLLDGRARLTCSPGSLRGYCEARRSRTKFVKLADDRHRTAANSPRHLLGPTSPVTSCADPPGPGRYPDGPEPESGTHRTKKVHGRCSAAGVTGSGPFEVRRRVGRVAITQVLVTEREDSIHLGGRNDLSDTPPQASRRPRCQRFDAVLARRRAL